MQEKEQANTSVISLELFSDRLDDSNAKPQDNQEKTNSIINLDIVLSTQVMSQDSPDRHHPEDIKLELPVLDDSVSEEEKNSQDQPPKLEKDNSSAESEKVDI